MTKGGISISISDESIIKKNYVGCFILTEATNYEAAININDLIM